MAPHDDRRRRRPRAWADPAQRAPEAPSALETPRNRSGRIPRVPSLCLVVDDQVNRRPIRVFAGAPAEGPQLWPAAESHLDFEGPSTGIGLGVAVRPGRGRTSELSSFTAAEGAPRARAEPFSASSVIVTQHPGVLWPARGHRANVKRNPVQIHSPAVLSGRVPDELSTTRTAYCVCDEPISRRAIEVWSLVAQELQQFTGPEPDFKAWRRGIQNGPGGGPTAG